MTNLPKWIKAIPESQSHGSGTLQKRLWKLTSDFVRIRDFYAYGRCAATGIRIEHWKDGDAGHFKAYSKCNGLFKFDTRNIFLQKKTSNAFGDYDDWINFEAEVFRRTGLTKQMIDRINFEHSLKFTTEEIIDRMKTLLEGMRDLPEQPDYFQRAYALLDNK